MWHTVWIQTRFPDLGINCEAPCVKLFGPRSNLTFCLVWSGSKLFIMFIKVISCHFYLVSNSMDPDQDRHFVKTVYGGVQGSSLFSVKWYGSRSRPIFWWAWSGSKLFIKVSALFQSFCEVFTFCLDTTSCHDRHIFFLDIKMYPGRFCEKNSIS